jgi:hypothetical protein
LTAALDRYDKRPCYWAQFGQVEAADQEMEKQNADRENLTDHERKVWTRRVDGRHIVSVVYGLVLLDF